LQQEKKALKQTFNDTDLDLQIKYFLFEGRSSERKKLLNQFVAEACNQTEGFKGTFSRQFCS